MGSDATAPTRTCKKCGQEIQTSYKYVGDDGPYHLHCSPHSEPPRTYEQGLADGRRVVELENKQ